MLSQEVLGSSPGICKILFRPRLDRLTLFSDLWANAEGDPMEVIMECRSEPEQNFNRCPESHPYAYNNGYDCCASPFEDFTDGFGRRCDGSPISIESWVVLFFI